MLECFGIPSSSGPHLIRTLHCDTAEVALHSIMAHNFTELYKPLGHNKAVIHEEGTLHYPNINPSSVTY